MKKNRTGAPARLARTEKGINAQCMFKCPTGNMACPVGVLLPQILFISVQNVHRGR